MWSRILENLADFLTKLSKPFEFFGHNLIVITEDCDRSPSKFPEHVGGVCVPPHLPISYERVAQCAILCPMLFTIGDVVMPMVLQISLPRETVEFFLNTHMLGQDCISELKSRPKHIQHV